MNKDVGLDVGLCSAVSARRSIMKGTVAPPIGGREVLTCRGMLLMRKPPGMPGGSRLHETLFWKPPSPAPSATSQWREAVDACTWSARELSADLSGAGSAVSNGTGNAWGIIGLAEHNIRKNAYAGCTSNPRFTKVYKACQIE